MEVIYSDPDFRDTKTSCDRRGLQQEGRERAAGRKNSIGSQNIFTSYSVN